MLSALLEWQNVIFFMAVIRISYCYAWLFESKTRNVFTFRKKHMDHK